MIELHTAAFVTEPRAAGARPSRTFREFGSESCPRCGALLSAYNPRGRCFVCAGECRSVSADDPELAPLLLHHLLVAYPEPFDAVATLSMDAEVVKLVMRKLRRGVWRAGHDIVGVRPRGYVYVVSGTSTMLRTKSE